MTKPTNDSAPVTKGDLKALQRELMQNVQHYLNETLEEKFEENRRYTDEKFQESRSYMDKKSEETQRHFDVVAENLTHDFQGAFKDRTEQHQDAIGNLRVRVNRLEKHAGLMPVS